MSAYCCIKLDLFINISWRLFTAQHVRAFSRPSSGAQWLQLLSVVLPVYRGDSRAVFVVGPVMKEKVQFNVSLKYKSRLSKKNLSVSGFLINLFTHFSFLSCPSYLVLFYLLHLRKSLEECKHDAAFHQFFLCCHLYEFVAGILYIFRRSVPSQQIMSLCHCRLWIPHGSHVDIVHKQEFKICKYETASSGMNVALMASFKKQSFFRYFL